MEPLDLGDSANAKTGGFFSALQTSESRPPGSTSLVWTRFLISIVEFLLFLGGW